MIRKYENDFTVEKESETEAYKRVKRTLVLIIIFSCFLVVFAIPFIFLTAPETKGNDFSKQMLFVTIIAFAIIEFIFCVSLLIVTLVQFKKNKFGKKETPFKFGQLCSTLLVILSTSTVLMSFIGYNSTDSKNARYGVSFYESVINDNYQKLVNKEHTSDYRIIESKKETFDHFEANNISTILGKEESTYTTEEKALADEYDLFDTQLLDIVNSYYLNNICFITEDVSSFEAFTENYDFGLKVYSISDAIKNDVEIMELSPMKLGKMVELEGAGSDVYYFDKPLYVNHTNLNRTTGFTYNENTNEIKIIKEPNGAIKFNRYDCSIIQSLHEQYSYVHALEEDSAYTRRYRYGRFFEYFVGDEEVFKKYNVETEEFIFRDYLNNNGRNQKVIKARKEVYKKIYNSSRIPLFIIVTLNLVYIAFLLIRKNRQIAKLDYNAGSKAVIYQSKYVGRDCDVIHLLGRKNYAAAIKNSNAIQIEYVAKRKAEIAATKEFVKQLNLDTKSTFDGHAIQLFGWNLLGWLVTIFTLGILYPVKVAWVEGWKINHRYINGKKLDFDGNGFQLLGRYMLWWLLCIVTLGIYLIVLPKKMQQWVLSHTHFVDVDHLDVKTKKLYLDHGVTNESKFEGKVIKLFFVKLGTSLLALVTLGLLLPMRICAVYKWKVNGQNINGLKVRFNGHAIQLFGKYLLWWLLSIVTIGIYLIFVPVKIEKWITKHSHFKAAYFDEEI